MPTKDEFVLRLATERDAPTLRRLIEISVRGLMGHDYSQNQLDGALGSALGLDTQLIADLTYFVATEAGDPDTIAACGGWSYRKTLFGSDGASKREAALLDPEVDAAKIRAIFVRPEFARRGLGTLILRHCEAVAESVGFRRFEMGATLTGVSLYAREGYIAAEEVHVALPNGEILPILKMTKVLQAKIA